MKIANQAGTDGLTDRAKTTGTTYAVRVCWASWRLDTGLENANHYATLTDACNNARALVDAFNRSHKAGAGPIAIRVYTITTRGVQCWPTYPTFSFRVVGERHTSDVAGYPAVK